jgi:ADP-ribosyl-[dinitrogen reductase] hydrolase
MPAPEPLLKKSQYRGALLGLAAGDAVGTTLEFKRPGTFEPISDMVGGGPFKLQPGEWTDDTSMALCLAESLVEKQGFDPQDQMERYVKWWRQGHLSSNGVCFDIGCTVRSALTRFLSTKDPYAGPTAPDTAGNGALMRIAPIALAFAKNPKVALENARSVSKTTHGAETSVDACKYFTGLLVGALQGLPKEKLLEKHYSPTWGVFQNPLHPEILEIANGSFKKKNPSNPR